GFRATESVPPADLSGVERAIGRGMTAAQESLLALGLPFRFPEIEPIALLWPGAADAGKLSPPDEDEEYADGQLNSDALESAEVLAWVKNQTMSDVVISTIEKLLDRLRT